MTSNRHAPTFVSCGLHMSLSNTLRLSGEWMHDLHSNSPEESLKPWHNARQVSCSAGSISHGLPEYIGALIGLQGAN